MFGYRSLACGVAFFTAFLCISHSFGEEPSKPSGRLRTLQKEKVDLLELAYKQMSKDYSDGTIGILEVVRSHNRLLKAKLPLATSKKERMAILKERVDNLKRWETMCRRNYQAGDTEADTAMLHKVRVKRLNAEIALAREESVKAGKQTP